MKPSLLILLTPTCKECYVFVVEYWSTTATTIDSLMFEELVEQVNRTDELLVELMLGNTCWCIELSKIRSATNGMMVLNEVQTEVYYDKNGITSVMASEYRRQRQP
uniref:Uncharacterized protein n=1 Tax=Oryza barthii TaxID=65489 RepID=A0A0D3GEI7_9ORYZ